MIARHLILGFVCLGALTITVGAPGCGGDDRPSNELDGSAGDAPVCATGTACGDGGVCAADVCCEKPRVCGDGCCVGEQFCSFGRCLAPGKACVDSTDCALGEYCEYALGRNEPAPASDAGCQGGASQLAGRCLARPPICVPDGGKVSSVGAALCLERCEHRATGAFTPSLRYAWGGELSAPFSTDVMMTPIVIELDDDNCDGKVNEQDIPEIVFATFTGGEYTKNGTLHAISIVKGAVVHKWSKPGEVNPAGQLAAGNIDGQPGNEIVACGADGFVHAYRGDGTPRWKSETILGCAMPSIADLDGDGNVEVVVEGTILDGATGKTEKTYASGRSFVISDIDGDGKLDIVTSDMAFDAAGTLMVDTGLPAAWPAIGDFDKDGKPEVVALDNANHRVSFWHYDAASPQKFSWVRQNVDINGTLVDHCPSGTAGSAAGGGPPTVADFDGDGVPDVALAGGIGYTVLNGAKIVNPAVAAADTLLWATPTVDCSSAATGSSVFDFDGDGKAEVVYSDENYLRIYEGTTGKVLFETCNTTGTLIEYPVVADVDNDGHADIVVASNSYANSSPGYQCKEANGAISQAGVRIFGDLAGSWVRTRRVWNQHAYHITNVNEDGTIPAHELPNWKQPGLNNFRQNKEPGSEFAAADAIVGLRARCDATYTLVATVTNIGEAALPPGVVVGFYAGTPPSGTRVGQATTTRWLFSAQSEEVSLALPTPPAGAKDGTVTLYAVLDDAATPHPSWQECRIDNNTSAPISGACNTIR